MATISIPKRVCDRCGDTVTDNGGRFALRDGGPHHVAPVPDDDAEAHDSINESMPLVRFLSVDLCRGCKGSLLSWWDRAEPRRRAAAKEGASQ